VAENDVELHMTAGWQEELVLRLDTFFEEKLGPDIAEDARQFAPVDTGYLREHISHSVDGHELRVTAAADYAAAVENGHRVVVDGQETGDWVDPQPFLQPALFKTRRYR
jgi:hypothetical protein